MFDSKVEQFHIFGRFIFLDSTFYISCIFLLSTPPQEHVLLCQGCSASKNYICALKFNMFFYCRRARLSSFCRFVVTRCSQATLVFLPHSLPHFRVKQFAQNILQKSTNLPNAKYFQPILKSFQQIQYNGHDFSNLKSQICFCA